jgi:uncharacterized membrane protein YraQ (UPF0718 family)/copper chaperone CopZ
MFKTIMIEIYNVYLSLAPYLFIGLTFAGILHIFVGTDLITRFMGKKGFWSSVKASLLGVPMPLCSCGVIPTAFQLRKSGASQGATVSFLISTPQTGIDSIIPTYAMLGPIFAVFRPIYALISGIIGGTITDNFVKNVKDEHLVVEKSSCSSGCCSSHSHSHSHAHKEEKGNKFTEFIKYAYGEFLDDLTPQLIVGIVLAGLISIIPDSIFTFVQGSYLLQLLVVLAIGIPLYVCATSSIPIALALIAKGLTPGAAFVFLVVGPATNVATITLITNALGKKIVGLYVGIIAITGVIGGLALDYLHKVVGFDLHSHMQHGGHGEDSLFLTILTVIFSIFFAVSVFKYVRNKITNIKGGGSQVKTQEVNIEKNDEMKFKVTSMTCNHCKGNITKALEKVAEIKSFDIDLASKIVTVKSSLTNDEIKQVIEGSGYPVD